MQMSMEYIETQYGLNEPPDLTLEIATSRWREINILLHSVTLLGEELAGRRPLHALLRVSAALVRADRALLYLRDPAGATRLTAVIGTGVQTVATDLAAQSLQARACLQSGRPIVVNEPIEPWLRAELSDRGANAGLTVPITCQRMPWAAVQLLRSGTFLKEEAVLLWLFALTLEGVLPTLLVRAGDLEIIPGSGVEEATMAPEQWRSRLRWEMKRSSWAGRSLAVVCLRIMMAEAPTTLTDLPSDVEREIASLLRKALGPHDAFSRTGLGRYSIVMPDAGRRDAQNLLTRVREALAQAGNGGPKCLRRLVCGVAVFPEDGDSESEMMKAASPYAS